MGSRQETLAIAALTRKRYTHFMTTLTVVNAIIHIGNGIISAVSGGTQANGEGDKLEKTLASLKELLIPEDTFDKESKVQKALRTLQEEVAKGPLQVRAMSTGSKTSGRIIRRRSTDVSSGTTTEP